jgi:hypothetical protein
MFRLTSRQVEHASRRAAGHAGMNAAIHLPCRAWFIRHVLLGIENLRRAGVLCRFPAERAENTPGKVMEA